MAYKKGQIIILDNKKYRILNISGSVAEVIGMEDANSNIAFGSDKTYAGSTLDTYLNETFYATLSDRLKAAIIDKTFTQDSWYRTTQGDPDYTAIHENSSIYNISLGSATFGTEITRHIYALSVQDVIDYLGATPEMTSENTTITKSNVNTMFMGSESGGGTSYNIWLRSANATAANQAYQIAGGSSGGIAIYSITASALARAAFQVDLDAYLSPWTNPKFKDIAFPENAGTDSGNVTLIDFLNDNASQVALTTFDLTSLGLSAGDHTIKVKATATGYADSDFSNSVTYSAYEQLATPVCSISGDTLSWAAISNAASYTLYVDSVSTQTGLTGTSFDLSTLSLAQGTYSIQLQAVGSGYYTDSDLSAAVSYEAPEPSTMPSKGDLITMNVDGTDKQFRVLNVNGNNAEVVMMSNASNSQQFDASSQVYAGSALDTYLNSTWYATLNATAQAAIVDKTFTQDSWYWGDSGDPDYSGYYGTSKPGTSAYTISLGSATFGSSITRHVYALSVQDVLDYVLDASITDGQLQNYNIWKMFWNDEVQHTGATNYLWLRSAYASSSSRAFFVFGGNGYVGSINVDDYSAVRPAFTIDLTKISWT